MLEFDDIQHLLLTRAPALTARYEFLSFRDAAGARAWVSAIKETIYSAELMRAGVGEDKRWVTAAFTWNGLRALGLDEASLASFPEEFKQGMAARAEVLGDSGMNAPEHWGRRACEPRSACDRHSLCAGRGGARPLRLGAWEASRQLPRRRGPLDARPSRDSAVRLRA